MEGMDYLLYILEYVWQNILTEGLMFWVLFLGQWGLFILFFCESQKNWDLDITIYGYKSAVMNSSILAVFSMGMPVLQVGLWLDYGYDTTAWAALLVPFVFALISM
jgi:hypothetical protein